jgi:Rho-binding antiterminator
MNKPISCEFYDQLMVAIQRKIPSTIVYLENEQSTTMKGVVTELMMIEYEEFLVLKGGKKINLQTIFSFNGKKHKEVSFLHVKGDTFTE